MFLFQGGHVDSYTDPATNTPYDYGVASYTDYGNATSFVKSLGIEPVSPSLFSPTLDYVDFDTGLPVNFTWPAADAQTAAVERYIEVCELYEDMLFPGYWNFPNGSDIPEDLLLPFGVFATKYNITDALPLMFDVTLQGMGNFVEVLTMYVMKGFNCQLARAMVGTQATFKPASGRNQDVYDAIAELLGDNVRYNSTASSMSRTDDGVTVTIKSSDGTTTTYQAKKLLVAVAPTLENLAPFDLNEQETEAFSHWTWTTLFVGLLSHPSLPLNQGLYNLQAAAAPANYMAYPAVNLTCFFDAVAEDTPIFQIIVAGDEYLDESGAKALAQQQFDNMLASGTIPASNQTSQLEYLAWANHGPMTVAVTAEELRGGFIQRLYALQGHRSTWYTSAGFS